MPGSLEHGLMSSVDDSWQDMPFIAFCLYSWHEKIIYHWIPCITVFSSSAAFDSF